MNPDPDVLLALANNQMRIQITRTGYPDWAAALQGGTKLNQAVFSSGPIFDGVTVGVKISRTSGGKVTMNVEATDPIIMLEKAMLETNLRFDGCNYVTALCLLFRHTDYASMLEVRLTGKSGHVDAVNSVGIGGHWMGAQRADELFQELAASHYFGYSPTTGRAYDVPTGTMLMSAIRGLMSKMSTPKFVPLFYWDPTSSRFVLTRRSLPDTSGLWPGGSTAGVKSGGSYTHPWIFDAPSGMIDGSGWSKDGPLAAGLMMQANKGQDVYSLESSTRYLTSHYLAFGTNRATGTPVKATAVNPYWNRLKGTTDVSQWAKMYGHIGYRSKKKDESPNFISDQVAALRYCEDQMWWLMRPVLRVGGITIDGVLFPGGFQGGLLDGTLGLVIGNDVFQNAFLDTCTIRYDAENQRVQSSITCYIFPQVQAPVANQ